MRLWPWTPTDAAPPRWPLLRPSHGPRLEGYAMSFLPDAIRTPVAFVVVLGVLVFIHEMGHYLAARWRGVHVEAFSIGFGAPIARWTDRVGTEWRLCWLPLGGYVKLHGQERPED